MGMWFILRFRSILGIKISVTEIIMRLKGIYKE